MKSTIGPKKPRGRPATGTGVQVQVRVQPEHLAALDSWIAERHPEPISRPEALRRLSTESLEQMGYLAPNADGRQSRRGDRRQSVRAAGRRAGDD